MTPRVDTLPAIRHDGQLTLAFGHNRNSKSWKNKTLLWSQLLEKLSQTTRTRETMAEYDAMQKPQQDEIKDVGGFVGGSLKGGRRKAENVAWRHILTLDADFAPVDMWSQIIVLNSFACCIYSTHKHRIDKPRLRFVAPMKRPVTPDEYQAISRAIAADIGSVDWWDDTTYEPSRLMYYASTSADGEFVFKLQDGAWLDPDEILASYGPDEAWKDPANWPESSLAKQQRRKMADKQGDPLTKPGLIGAFCRTYSIDAAIETFLPDVYEQTATEGRYTYAKGSTAGGLVLYDDGRFAYSHHGTDPISGKLVNAWDLIRIHKFGVQDEDSAPDTPGNKLPSYTAMRHFAEEDEKVAQTLRVEREQEWTKDFADDLPGSPQKMFFEEHRFIPKFLGDWFLSRFSCFRISDKLFVYEAGRYVPAESFFYTECTQVLQKEFTTSRVSEAMNYVINISDTVAPDEANSTGKYLNLRNGLLNLETLELTPHTPKLRTIVQLPVEYDPEATCPAFDEFLGLVAHDSTDTIEEMIGNCLEETMRHEKAFLLYGAGKNGKGTLLAVLQKFFGEDNVANVALQTLSENRFAAAELFGKRVNLYADLPNKLIEDSSTFKMLVSGDSLSAERKHQQPFRFKNRAKLIFSTNELSSSRDNTEGFFRRWVIIPFPVKFTDSELRSRLFRDSEMSGILLRAINGLRRLRSQKGFTVPQAVAELDELYREKSDTAYRFLREQCTAGSRDNMVGKQELYDSYRTFCRDWGNNPVSQSNFNYKLKIVYPEAVEDRNKIEGRTTRKWRGIVLLEDSFLE